ncbi:MAG: TonB-dependent receptor plug domain-containing protein [Saprospiraceae bacterium]|nr:TonB-dependent receptor plug domain-containing protein [Saprospiraceae bacterium]
MLLPTVEVNATSLRNEQPGSFCEKWSDTTLSRQIGQSVADFLQNQTGIYLKSYGSGSLATTSIRGASSSQTAVLWNGFQVQSPMLGLLDWSLLPASFSDEISLQHGGNSAVWGSGAIGGAVLMENRPDFDTKKQVKMSTGIGSFGWWSGEATAKFANKKWATATRIFYQKAKNDFIFEPSPGLPDKHQTNAAQWQGGLLQEFYWRPSGKQQLGWQTWLQRAFREIPPTTTQTRSEANQSDEVLRTALNWKLNYGRNSIQVRSALFREAIRYLDGQIGLNAPSHFWTSISEAEWQRYFSDKITLQIAGNQTFTKAFIKNYQSAAERRQSAVFASLRLTQGQWSAQLDGRCELVDGKLVPITPSFGLDRNVQNWLKIGAKIGRNYRLPTLNDLHWIPGGNPDLLAESGWSEELNVHFSWKKKQSGISFSTSIFNRTIENWLRWHPTEVQPFWSASNIAEVWSRGVENRLHWALQHGKWHFKMDAGYDYTRSTNQKVIKIPKTEVGQQLDYVPENQGFVAGEIQLNGLGFSYRHHFTGSVRTDLGSLPRFQIGTVLIDFEQPIGGWPTRIFFQIENCWDTNYRVIERRPMPGRNFIVGMSTIFTKH